MPICSTKAESSGSTGVTLNLSTAIQQAVGAKVGAPSRNTQSSELTYKGQEMLTFGHKVFRIELING
jgi:hypothetical protein